MAPRSLEFHLILGLIGLVDELRAPDRFPTNRWFLAWIPAIKKPTEPSKRTTATTAAVARPGRRLRHLTPRSPKPVPSP